MQVALLVGDVAVAMAVARYKWKNIKLQAFFTFLFAALILYSYQFLFINCINTFVQLSYTIFRFLHTTMVLVLFLTSVFRCQSIAAKLATGIPFKDVLDSLHTSATASGSQILHFITKNDLQNISHTFGVHRHQTLHKNDADSVAAWVEHTRQQTSTQNLVRYIKYQGCLLYTSPSPRD